MVLQVVAVLALILNTAYPLVNDALVLLMVAATVWSGIEYFVAGRRHLRASVTR